LAVIAFCWMAPIWPTLPSGEIVPVTAKLVEVRNVIRIGPRRFQRHRREQGGDKYSGQIAPSRSAKQLVQEQGPKDEEQWIDRKNMAYADVDAARERNHQVGGNRRQKNQQPDVPPDQNTPERPKQ
jgi:hypothetical protein